MRRPPIGRWVSFHVTGIASGGVHGRSAGMERLCRRCAPCWRPRSTQSRTAAAATATATLSSAIIDCHVAVWLWLFGCVGCGCAWKTCTEKYALLCSVLFCLQNWSASLGHSMASVFFNLYFSKFGASTIRIFKYRWMLFEIGCNFLFYTFYLQYTETQGAHLFKYH